MGLFNFSKKETATVEAVVAGFETCIKRTFGDEVQVDRRKVRKLFRNSSASKEDIVKALMEKYYVSELTRGPEPVEFTHGNERYKAILMLSQPSNKEVAQKYTAQFVNALLNVVVGERKFCDISLTYAYYGRTQFEMTLYRCSDKHEWSLPQLSCEMVRDNEALAKAFRVFCEACNRCLEEESDPERMIFTLHKSKFWEE